MDDRDTLLDEVERLTVERDEWKKVAHDGAFQQARAEKAEAERDCLRAFRDAVLGLADEAKRRGSPFVYRTEVDTLAAEHGLSERQDAPEPPADAATGDGSREGVNGAQEGAGEFGLRHIDVALSLEAFERAMGEVERTRVRTAEAMQQLADAAKAAACGDVLRDHGAVGPCVLSGSHGWHDDGRGTTWSRKRVEP
jgi:hypothetical protein